MLDGSVGSVVHSNGTVVLVGNHWLLFCLAFLFVIASTLYFVEKGVRSNVSLEALLVRHGDKIEEGNGLSQNQEGEIEPLEVQGLERFHLLCVEFLAALVYEEAAVGNPKANGHGQG